MTCLNMKKSKNRSAKLVLVILSNIILRNFAVEVELVTKFWTNVSLFLGNSFCLDARNFDLNLSPVYIEPQCTIAF